MPVSNRPLVPLRHAFEALSIGGLKIRNPSVYLGEMPILDPANFSGPVGLSNTTKPDLVLGTHVLRLLHLYVAVKERKLYFTPA
jgi:hypothetical protein